MRMWFTNVVFKSAPLTKARGSYTLLTQNDPYPVIKCRSSFDGSISNAAGDTESNMEEIKINENIDMDGTSYLELVGSKKRRNFKKISIISLIFLVVIAVIVVVVVLVTRGNDDDQNGKKPSPSLGFELEDWLYGRLVPSRNNATWISDKELMYRDLDDNIVKYNVETENTSLIVSSSIDIIKETHEYELSPDKKFLLVASNYRNIFRHSNAAKYDVINLETNEITPVQVNGEQHHLLLAKWSPATNAIVFVYNFNIFYIPSIGAKEIQITTGGDGIIRYGVTDWVYEEEVFASKEALWFSPNGQRLAYIMFDDTNVEIMHIPVYGIPGDIEYQYPKTFSLNYPKPGTPNPDVRLYYVDLSTLSAGDPVNRTEVSDPVKNRKENERIITAVTWQNNDWIISVWMNRIQNEAIIQTCSYESGGSTCNTIKTLTSTTGWIELFKPPLVRNDGSQILLIASQDQGAAGSFRHLALISTNQDEIVRPVTSGNYVVIDYIHWDQTTDYIFYKANVEDDPNAQHIYAVKAQEGQQPHCLTCNIEVNGIKQTFFSAAFSKTGNNLVLTVDGPSVTNVHLYSWNIDKDQVTIKRIREWEANPQIHELLQKKASPTSLFKSIKLKSNYNATIKLQIPPNADLTGKVKYPLIVDVYGGPDSYAGTNRFNLDYGSFLSSNQSIIIAQINARGCGMRGDKIMHEIYQRLGTVEIEDQIDATKELGKLPYVDEKRMAIWGWSYGGYAAGMALAKDNETVFQCAASVAPVTDWIYYDTIYTERYMNLPEKNEIGYKNGRLSTMHENFRGKNYFLIHGTLDDNVHFQQSMALSRSLELNDVLFTQMSYVDENHSLGLVRRHLYHSLGRFFDSCLKLSQNS